MKDDLKSGAFGVLLAVAFIMGQVTARPAAVAVGAPPDLPEFMPAQEQRDLLEAILREKKKQTALVEASVLELQEIRADFEKQAAAKGVTK